MKIAVKDYKQIIMLYKMKITLKERWSHQTHTFVKSENKILAR